MFYGQISLRYVVYHGKSAKYINRLRKSEESYSKDNYLTLLNPVFPDGFDYRLIFSQFFPKDIFFIKQDWHMENTAASSFLKHLLPLLLWHYTFGFPRILLSTFSASVAGSLSSTWSLGIRFPQGLALGFLLFSFFILFSHHTHSINEFHGDVSQMSSSNLDLFSGPQPSISTSLFDISTWMSNSC